MEMKSLLKQLVETESPTLDKAAVDAVGRIVAEEARGIGGKVELIRNQETGNHVTAKWGSGKGGILLLCHMDTVFPLGTLKSMPYREADGKIFGPGAQDMKAGIAICLGAMAELQKSNELKGPVTLLCTSDEEAGSGTSRTHIEKYAKEASLVLVFEPALPDRSLKTWRKGVGQFFVRVKGRAAHSGGDHEKGRNAIEEMAHQVIRIQKLTDYSKQTTVNVGVMNGGTVSNVVPEHAFAQVDVRVMQPGEWERVETEMKRLSPVLEGITLTVEGDLNRPPMPFDETMKATFEKAKSIAAGIGMELKAGGTGGASDGNFIAPFGIPVLDGMGAVGDGYHSDREFIYENSLEEKKNLLVELIKKW